MRALVSPATAAAIALAGCSDTATTPDAAPADAADAPIVSVVGHEPLLARGMNAALAIAGDHAYIGSRTDGGLHDDAGVLIVDISDPASPEVVGQIGPPDQALLGISSRELRTLPEHDLLVVLNFACDETIHACSRNDEIHPLTGGAAEADNLKIYDISDPVAPTLVSTYSFGTTPDDSIAKPHEMYLWQDPADGSRALLYLSTPLGPPNMQVLDLSPVIAGTGDVALLASFDTYGDAGFGGFRTGDNLLHSVGLTDDGTLAILSHQGSGILLVDVSAVARGDAEPVIALTHALEDRIDYSPPELPGTHSATPIPGRDMALVVDEVYPRPLFPGCPWGWARIVDYSDRTSPTIVSEYKLPENEVEDCFGNNPQGVAYTAHNATVTENLALIPWHAGGLQIVDISDPGAPQQIHAFFPEPLAEVQTEDPALGGDPVLMWSYPIIKDGLIYVVDIRNGLYVLRYDGPSAAEITARAFAEGNSNLTSAAR